MPDLQTDLVRPVPSIVPSDIPAMSDDECLVRLAQAVQDQDSAHLDEVARLIGRLAVTIEKIGLRARPVAMGSRANGRRNRRCVFADLVPKMTRF